MSLKITVLTTSILFLSLTTSAQIRSSDAVIPPPGAVQGVVIRSGSQEPIADVQVALSGGSFDPNALGGFLSFMASRGVQMAPPAGAATDDKFIQSVLDTAAARGLSRINPEVLTALAAFNAANDARFSVLTDSQGRFTFKGVASGTYVIRAQKEGYFGIATNGTEPAVATATVTVANGDTGIVSLSMIPGATMSGRIRDVNGNPQPGVNVEALSLGYQNGFPVLQSVVAKPTDDRGEYRLFWLPFGEYFLAVTPRQSTQPAGLPASTIASLEQPVKTFYPGTAEVANAVSLAIRGGERLEGLDINIRTSVPVKISGVIHTTVPLPEGAIAVQASMLLLRHDTSVPDNLGLTSTGVTVAGNARIGASGGPFEITGILSGSYDLYARIREPNPDGGSGFTFGHASVIVGAENVQNVSIYVHPSVRVTGTITANGGSLNQGNLKVSLQPSGSAAKIPIYQGIAARPVPVNRQNGSFMIPAVTAGHFRLSVQGMPEEMYIADVRQSSSVYDSGFDIGSESPNPLQVILNSGAGRIDGIVRDSESKPVAGASVVLVPSEARRENREMYHNVISDSAGHFEIRNIAPESYKLFAWQSIAAGAYYNVGLLQAIENRGQSIRVIQDSKITAEIVAIPIDGR